MAGFVQSGDRRIYLDEVRQRARRAATGWARMGVDDGGTVAIMLRNDIPFLEAVLAAITIGAYSVPINWHYSVDEASFVLADCAAGSLVIHADLLRRIRPAIPAHVTVLCVPTPPEVCRAYGIPDAATVPPDDCLDWDRWLGDHAPWAGPSAESRGTMVYTSGTTGRPKGVKRQPISAENRDAYAALTRQWFGHQAGMRTAMIGPLYHSVQTSYALAATRSNADIFLRPRFDAEEVLKLIGAEKLTHLHLVPTMMSRLLQLPNSIRESYDLSSLQFVIHGAAPCAPDIKRRMIEWWGPIIHEYYGTSEAGMVSRSSSEEWLQREGTVGRAWPGRMLRIYSGDGNVLPPDVEGEVYMSLGIMPDFTYHNADDKRKTIERDGLISNGDIGYLDKDGYLFLCDRKHDIVISGGVNIYPAEIEAVLVTHPAVVDCAVFGAPDEELGEFIVAAVQTREGERPSSDELAKFVGARLAKFKIPRRFEFHAALPREDSGKVFKRILRDPYWSAVARRI